MERCKGPLHYNESSLYLEGIVTKWLVSHTSAALGLFGNSENLNFQAKTLHPKPTLYKP